MQRYLESCPIFKDGGAGASSFIPRRPLVIFKSSLCPSIKGWFEKPRSPDRLPTCSRRSCILPLLFSPMNFLSSQSYVFDPRPNYPLLVTAKCYWNPASPHLNSKDALTLVFVHGSGLHKEQWEPTITDLYDLVPEGIGSAQIREVWAVDLPNHGDAAVLNEKTLQWGYEPICVTSLRRPDQELIQFSWMAGIRARSAFISIGLWYGCRCGLQHSAHGAHWNLVRGCSPVRSLIAMSSFLC
jgi:hypothetical protein